MAFEGPEFAELSPVLPTDHARVANLDDMFRSVAVGQVLDLGCGDGRAVELIESTGAHYTGVDIEKSPEVTSRTRSDARFVTFNGVDLPFADASFDVVYSNQVFEHVRHPDRLAAEVRRVLRPHGAFVGALSYLEPYHSFSIFNFTPYGIFRVLSDNGFVVEQLRPGPEGLALLMRQLTIRRINRFGFVYPAIDMARRLGRIDIARANYLKLRFAGHILFTARRPA